MDLQGVCAVESFMFMLIISLFLKAFISENRKNDIKIKINFTNAFYPVALSLSVVFGNKLNLYLSGVIPGIIFFRALMVVVLH